MDAQTFLDNFDIIAEAPGGVDRLRDVALKLAVSGQLVEQTNGDDPARIGLQAARAEKDSTLANSVRGGRLVTRIPGLDERAKLPAGWERARLDDTGEYINGLAFKNSDWKSSGIPIIRIQNLTKPSAPFNYADGPFPEDRMVHDGDILVSWSATLNAFRWNRGGAVLNQHIFKVVPDRRVVTADFLFHLLRRCIRAMAESEAAHGLVMKHINKGPFLSHVIALPPLAEQGRIVAKLDELMDRCDELEASQERRHRNRTRLRSSALHALTHAETGGEVHEAWERMSEHWHKLLFSRADIVDLQGVILGLLTRGRLSERHPAEGYASTLLESIRLQQGGRQSSKQLDPAKELPFAIPSTWHWAPLGDLALKMRYGSAHKSHTTGAVPVLRMGNLQNGEIDWSNLKFTSGVGEIEKYSLPSPAVLFNRTNSPDLVGKTAIYRGERPAAFAGYLIHVVPAVGLEPEYLNLVLNSPLAKSWCANVRSDGISQSNISASKLAGFPFPLPPQPEQLRIVEAANDLLGLCDDLSSTISRLNDLQVSVAGMASVVGT